MLLGKLKNCWEINNCENKINCLAFKRKMGHSCWSLICVFPAFVCARMDAVKACGSERVGHTLEVCENCKVYEFYNREDGKYRKKIISKFPHEEEKYQLVRAISENL